MKRRADTLRRKEIVGRWASDPCRSIPFPRFFTFIHPFFFFAHFCFLFGLHVILFQLFPFHLPRLFLSIYSFFMSHIPLHLRHPNNTHPHPRLSVIFFFFRFLFNQPHLFSLFHFHFHALAPHHQIDRKMTNQDKQPDGGTCHFYFVFGARDFLLFPACSFLVSFSSVVFLDGFV